MTLQKRARTDSTYDWREDGEQVKLPGAAHMLGSFNRFKSTLPALAATLDIGPDEIDPFRDCRDYTRLLAELLRQV